MTQGRQLFLFFGSSNTSSNKGKCTISWRLNQWPTSEIFSLNSSQTYTPPIQHAYLRIRPLSHKKVKCNGTFLYLMKGLGLLTIYQEIHKTCPQASCTHLKASLYLHHTTHGELGTNFIFFADSTFWGHDPFWASKKPKFIQKSPGFPGRTYLISSFDSFDRISKKCRSQDLMDQNVEVWINLWNGFLSAEAKRICISVVSHKTILS